ncbi:MAG TPA: hypothetical protein VJB95_01840 [Candidatus Paceibacterota bacterium]
MEKTPGKALDPLDLDKVAQEIKTIDPNVEELKSLVDTPEFQANFLVVQTRAEIANRNKLLNTPKRRGSTAKLTEAEEAIARATAFQTQKLNQLKEELKHPNPKLVEALNAWGRSRNLKKESGPERKGFNAGIVHYFEYRTHLRKNKKRYKTEHTVSIDGFIIYTERYSSFIKNQNPITNPEIETARLFEDPNGNRRLYVLTKEKEFVVGFQRAGQEMKILSVYLGQNETMLNRTADAELNSTEQARARFNHLESPVKEIALSGGIEGQASYELVSNSDYLGFQNVEVTEVDETKPWKLATKVKVTKKDGKVVEIDAQTPFFILRNRDGKELSVSAVVAGHIDSLHIKGTDAGSLFNEPSLQALMEDAARKIPNDVPSIPGISLFDMEMGKNMGKEGIASLKELQESGVLSAEDVQKALSFKEEAVKLNRSGTKLEKEAFIKTHSDEKVNFRLIRGEILVPVVDTPKRPTTKLFMVFEPVEGDTRKTLYTAAPGRKMPLHPNPTYHIRDGMVDEIAFRESAEAWFDTVMLAGA